MRIGTDTIADGGVYGLWALDTVGAHHERTAESDEVSPDTRLGGRSRPGLHIRAVTPKGVPQDRSIDAGFGDDVDE
jgi:hypothetical protein